MLIKAPTMTKAAGCSTAARPAGAAAAHIPPASQLQPPAPTFEKQCLRSSMNAFSCWVLRAVVRHTAPQYSKGVAQSPVSGLQQGQEGGRWCVAAVALVAAGKGTVFRGCKAGHCSARRMRGRQGQAGGGYMRPRHCCCSLVAAAVDAVHVLLRLVLWLQAAGHAVFILAAALVLL